jgi:flavin reductase (DIM6/NTAB) family NADH-FMN oxidoreductase RutF
VLTPGLQDADALLSTVVSISAESWRLLRTVERFALSLDGDQQRRIVSRIAFFEQRVRDELASVGLKLVDFTGQPYGPELAASAINADEFAAQDRCVVEQTLEPAVMGPEGLVRAGTVVLRRSEP